jgi:hypothetical protein
MQLGIPKGDMPSIDQMVVVACLGHSGSTLLDLVLGKHPRIVGLGEVFAAMGVLSRRPKPENPLQCTCGHPPEQCEIWGPVSARLRDGTERTREEKYAVVLDAFATVFGPGKIPVDISKNADDRLRSVKTIRLASPQTKVHIIHLLKDVRPYVISRMDEARRKELRRLPVIFHFWRWYRENRAMRRALDATGLPILQLGYEELCLQPGESVARITDFLGLEPEPRMVWLDGSSSHTLRGNRMRHQPEKNRNILYDTRWLHRNEWILPAALSPHIMRYNAREVYGNAGGSIWEA